MSGIYAPARETAASDSHISPVEIAPRNASDEEILGISLPAKKQRVQKAGEAGEFEFDSPSAEPGDDAPSSHASEPGADGEKGSEPANLRPIFEANPDLRKAWEDANAYRETFATPEEARNATALLADLNRLDALFYSRQPQDHAELARSIAELDPAAFSSLARAMNAMAAQQSSASQQQASQGGGEPKAAANSTTSDAAANEVRQNQIAQSTANLTVAQSEFAQSANAAAVRSVLDTVEAQAEKFLPEGASRGARNRVVGEIYRELDATLRANHQLARQLRDAFRSGALDAEHQSAVVSLITARARQALPGVAKRVMNEWTSTVMAANQDRRDRQHAAERRVDIAGSGGAGNDGHRTMTPREIDYSRLSDGDILNL
jgi:hypothetical protein